MATQDQFLLAITFFLHILQEISVNALRHRVILAPSPLGFPDVIAKGRQEQG